MAARSPALARGKLGARWPGAWLLMGFLLAVTAPAHGFDGQQQSPPIMDDLGLHSSGVPTAANWVVLDATGIAAWRAEGDTRWQRFSRGEVLPAGCEIETGSDGEVTLVAGGDQLTIAPQGRLIVPIAQPGQDRRLRHERGRILVQIEAREARDVRVDTPLLSLGIKGTTFEVLVEPTQDSVLVHEGDVEVTTPGDSDAVDLGTGEGLRQPAVPGSEPSRLSMPAPAGPAAAPDGPAWRLQPSAPDRPGQIETHGAPAAPDAAQTRDRAEREARGGSARAQPASSDDGIGFGQLDELASSWGSIALVAVGVVILAIAALALMQRRRQQWSGQPKPTAQRRRQLVRG
ncbi:MAG TPA: FecR family protein [Geminicoccaceae bacterium]|nr:FecR family protein [Geminicoccaceae bacterium]